MYSSSNPQKIEKPVLTILLGFHLFLSRGFIHTHNIIDIHLCHSLHIIIVFTSISYLHRCMYTHLIYIYIMHIIYIIIHIYNILYIRSDDVAMEAGGDLRRIGHWTRALAFLELMRAAQARDRQDMVYT